MVVSYGFKEVAKQQLLHASDAVVIHGTWHTKLVGPWFDLYVGPAFLGYHFMGCGVGPQPNFVLVYLLL